MNPRSLVPRVIALRVFLRANRWRLAAYVFAGACLTTAIAWGCASRAGMRGDSRANAVALGNTIWHFGNKCGLGWRAFSFTPIESIPDGFTDEAINRRLDFHRLDMARRRSSIVEPSLLGHPAGFSAECSTQFQGSRPSATLLRAGWPMSAVSCEIRKEVASGFQPSVHQGLDVPIRGQALGARQGTAIPFRPVLGGFVLNTALFAVCLASLVHVPLITLRSIGAWRARRRGLCPVCRYDLVGDFAGGCSECGWGRSSSESR